VDEKTGFRLDKANEALEGLINERSSDPGGVQSRDMVAKANTILRQGAPSHVVPTDQELRYIEAKEEYHLHILGGIASVDPLYSVGTTYRQRRAYPGLQPLHTPYMEPMTRYAPVTPIHAYCTPMNATSNAPLSGPTSTVASRSVGFLHSGGEGRLFDRTPVNTSNALLFAYGTSKEPAFRPQRRGTYGYPH